MGNTPTGVGKTRTPPRWARKAQKHPHGRGEDCASVGNLPAPVETPPRAWGRRIQRQVEVSHAGNTPTGVGKTLCGVHHRGGRWKHPHGRGEDGLSFVPDTNSPETPPRAWGRRPDRGKSTRQDGNTPTGVGKTLRWPRPRHARKKHPHGRGEDLRVVVDMERTAETPPRAWGRRKTRSTLCSQGGNTPTGVGKTRSSEAARELLRKHPHGRGEDTNR